MCSVDIVTCIGSTDAHIHTTFLMVIPLHHGAENMSCNLHSPESLSIRRRHWATDTRSVPLLTLASAQLPLKGQLAYICVCRLALKQDKAVFWSSQTRWAISLLQNQVTDTIVRIFGVINLNIWYIWMHYKLDCSMCALIIELMKITSRSINI